jgi:hypothetical protein
MQLSKKLGKFWKAAELNGLSHKSSKDPGGGGAKLSYQVESFVEHVSSELALSLETVELLLADASDA